MRHGKDLFYSSRFLKVNFRSKPLLLLGLCLVLGSLVPVEIKAQSKPFGTELPFNHDPFKGDETSSPSTGGGRDGEKAPPPPPPMPIDDHLWIIILGGAAIGWYYFKKREQPAL